MCTIDPNFHQINLHLCNIIGAFVVIFDDSGLYRATVVYLNSGNYQKGSKFCL